MSRWGGPSSSPESPVRRDAIASAFVPQEVSVNSCVVVCVYEYVVGVSAYVACTYMLWMQAQSAFCGAFRV